MKVKFFLIGILIFGLISCGTTSTIKPSGSLESLKNLPKLSFNSIKIDVKTEVEDSMWEVHLLKDFLADEFKAKNIEIKDSEADAEMVVVMKHLKNVSRGSRLWWGSLAGKAELRVDVTITTQNTAPVSFSVDTSSRGASSAGDWLSGYGGSTEDALERTAAKIVDEIL